MNPIPQVAGPMPLARTADPELILAVAQRAIGDATERAVVLSKADETLGEFERAETDRLRTVLATLIPELRSRSEHRPLLV